MVEELLAVLRGMGDALNPDCEFHRFNQDNPLASDRHKARLIQSICTLSFVMGYLACRLIVGISAIAMLKPA